MLEVSLKKAGFNVTTAVNGRDALDKVELAPPDLVICETQLAELDGFAFCQKLKSNPTWADIPFVFLTAQTEIATKIRGLELGVDDYLTKPIYIKEIVARARILLQKRQRTRIEERRDGRTRFAGHLSDMPIVDLIQTVEISRKSGLINFIGEGGKQAAIYFRDGKVIDAEAGPLQAEDAVYRLLTWNEGEFEVAFRTVRRRDMITMSAQALLMEGMRRLDEWGRLCEQLPPLDTRFEIDPGELTARLGDIKDEHNAIIRLFDGRRSVLEVIDACDYGDLESLEVIARLYFEGVLTEAGPIRPNVSAEWMVPTLDAPSTGNSVGSPTGLMPESDETAEAEVDRAIANLGSEESRDSRTSDPPPIASSRTISAEWTLDDDEASVDATSTSSAAASATSTSSTVASATSTSSTAASARATSSTAASVTTPSASHPPAPAIVTPPVIVHPPTLPSLLPLGAQGQQRGEPLGAEPPPRSRRPSTIPPTLPAIPPRKGPPPPPRSNRTTPSSLADDATVSVEPAPDAGDAVAESVPTPRKSLIQKAIDESELLAARELDAQAQRTVDSGGARTASAAGEVGRDRAPGAPFADEPAGRRRRGPETPTVAVSLDPPQATTATSSSGSEPSSVWSSPAGTEPPPTRPRTTEPPIRPAAAAVSQPVPLDRPARPRRHTDTDPESTVRLPPNQRGNRWPAVLVGAAVVGGLAFALVKCGRSARRAGQVATLSIDGGSGSMPLPAPRDAATPPRDAHTPIDARPTPVDARPTPVDARPKPGPDVPSPDDDVKRRLDAARKLIATDPQGALDLVDELLNDHRSPRALLLRADALRRLDRTDGAVAAADAAISMAPRNAASWEMKGKILWAAGRKAEARTAYERYLALQPTGATADTVRWLLSQP